MNELIHADVFFFVSTIGMVIIIILLSIALIYLIRILKSAQRIGEKVEEGIDNISDDTIELIEDVRNSMAFSFLFGRRKRKKALKSKDE